MLFLLDFRASAQKISYFFAHPDDMVLKFFTKFLNGSEGCVRTFCVILFTPFGSMGKIGVFSVRHSQQVDK